MQLEYPPDDLDVDTNMEVHISSLETTGKGKRKASAADLGDERPAKPRTLGGDRIRETVVVRELAPGSHLLGSDQIAMGALDSLVGPNLVGRLPMPSLLTYVKASVEGSEDILEGRNSEDGGKCSVVSAVGCRLTLVLGVNEVLYVSGKQTQWLDYVPSPILALVATSSFCAAALQDGSLNVYSPTGRR